TADTGFVRTLASQTQAALGSLDGPDSGLQEFTSDDFDAESDVSVFDSFSSAFVDSGIVTGGIRMLRDPTPNLLPDPEYDLEAHLKSQPEDLQFLQQFLDNPNDHSAGSLLYRLANSQNAEQTDHIIRQAREAQE